MDKIKLALTSIHEWVQRQWFIVSILLYTSSIWFSLIINFWGEKLKLIIIDTNGHRSFSFLGLLLTVVICLFSLIILVAQRYYEYETLDKGRNQRKLVLLEQVFFETNKICDNKFLTLKKKILDIKNGSITNIPNIASNPCEQLKHITEKMNNCLCALLTQTQYSIGQDELYISLYYNFPLENSEWNLADSIVPEKGLEISELLKEGTTFSKILSSKEPFLFYNSKEHARRIECYVRDAEDKFDENNELKGSIACYRFLIKEKGTLLIQAVLSITTYNKKFINSDNSKTIQNTRYNINKYIINPFEKRINIELCLLYLHLLSKSQHE